MKKSRGSGRAEICHPEKHLAGVLKGGKQPQLTNSHYEVHHQDEPTPGDPRRQHAKLAHPNSKVDRVGGAK